eukprot:5794183-Amphidinium_carterae.2
MLNLYKSNTPRKAIVCTVLYVCATLLELGLKLSRLQVGGPVTLFIAAAGTIFQMGRTDNKIDNLVAKLDAKLDNLSGRLTRMETALAGRLTRVETVLAYLVVIIAVSFGTLITPLLPWAKVAL